MSIVLIFLQLFIYLFIYLFVYVCIYLFIYLFIDLFRDKASNTVEYAAEVIRGVSNREKFFIVRTTVTFISSLFLCEESS